MSRIEHVELLQVDLPPKVARISFEATVRAVLPWIGPLLVTLALITYVPQLTLWLPGIMYP
jgi:TRAP-type C4-dicarboxylate transport system permease large subunit